MRVAIIAGHKEIYKVEIYEAVLPGLDGEFSVMDFHQPFLFRLRKGIIKINKTKGAKSEMLKIEDGIAKFTCNSLTILCEKDRHYT